MARKRAPQHRCDQTEATVILPDDDAWDHDRIKAEREKLADPDDHPVQQYWSGTSRYDLDAPVNFGGEVATARDYLDETKRPEKYVIRRLQPEEWERVQTAYEQDGVWRRATRLAVEMGLVRVEGCPQPLQLNKRKRITADDIRYLFDQNLLAPIGLAVYMHSRPLTAEEKKASDS